MTHDFAKLLTSTTYPKLLHAYQDEHFDYKYPFIQI